MATKKPRITITLEPEVYGTLQELAEVQGRSMSSLVAELLTLSNPIQKRVLAAIKTAAAVEVEARADLLGKLDEAEREVSSVMGPLLALLEGYAGAGQPPHSNTGVTTPNPPATQDQENGRKAHSRASGKKEEQQGLFEANGGQE